MITEQEHAAALESLHMAVIDRLERALDLAVKPTPVSLAAARKHAQDLKTCTQDAAVIAHALAILAKDR